MSLDARIDVQLGTLDLNASLQVAEGEVVAILGPNGAGKTTLLRTLAGFIPLDSGRITIGDQVVDDPGADVYVPPRVRPSGMIHQDVALFPTMSIVDNVAFGLRCAKTPKAQAQRIAMQWLERVGLANRAADRPAKLSGGQAQLVAIARTLATGVNVVLLDEPLAALDVQHRAAMREHVREVLDGAAAVLVTHDIDDARALADRIMFLEEGQVTQQGTIDEVIANPTTTFVHATMNHGRTHPS